MKAVYRRLTVVTVILVLVLSNLLGALAQEPPIDYCGPGCIEGSTGDLIPGGDGPGDEDTPGDEGGPGDTSDNGGPGDHPGDNNGSNPGNHPLPVATPTPCPGGVCPTPTPTPTPGPYQVDYPCLVPAEDLAVEVEGAEDYWIGAHVTMQGGSERPSREEVIEVLNGWTGDREALPATWLDLTGYFQHCSECEDSSSDSPGPPDFQDLPCPAEYRDGSLGTGCRWDIYTRDYLLPVRVKRQPWPRGLVTVPNILELMPDPRWGQAGEGGAWSGKAPQGYPDANTRNYTIGLRWKRIEVNGNEVCWDWDERPWNIGKDYGYGEIKAVTCGNPGTHIYETSSGDIVDPAHYGDEGDKPRNGPGLDMRTDLPAYQVGITTYWEAQWKVEYDRYEVVDHVEGWYYDGIAEDHMRCDPQYNDPRCKWVSRDIREWRHHEDGWHTIDLSKLRPGPWYEEWHAAVSFNGTPTRGNWVEEVPGVPVPVIEVQSVIVGGE